MKILVSPSEKELEPITFELSDYVISSVSLNERVSALHLFANKCFQISEERYGQLMTTETLEITPYYIHFKNGKMVFIISEINWKALNVMYATYNSFSKLYTLKRAQEVNEEKAVDLEVFRNEAQSFKYALMRARKDFNKQIPFFNAKKMCDAFLKRDHKASQYKDKVMVTFPLVKFGSEEEGFIIFNEIVIFITDFMIDGFILKFDNFDYSSYWKIPVILHPYLCSPYGYNNHLEFIPENDYVFFAESLIDTVSIYKGEGFLSVRKIIEDIQELRLLWNGNKMKFNENERAELSQVILKALK